MGERERRQDNSEKVSVKLLLSEVEQISSLFIRTQAFFFFKKKRQIQIKFEEKDCLNTI